MLWKFQLFYTQKTVHWKVSNTSYGITPVITLFISGLKSRVLKLSFLSLKMMVKSGLEFILKLTEPLQRYLLSCQANSANLGRYFCTGQQQLWRGSVNFKINSRPLFTIIFKLKNGNFMTRDFSPLIKRVLAGVSPDPGCFGSMYHDNYDGPIRKDPIFDLPCWLRSDKSHV